jgi:8-oxo-dGTP pyrophosphatase MutT (NUDIX family)
MESCMERSDAPEEWTTRQILCHLLFEPGWRPGPVLFSFAPVDLPVIEIKPGQIYLTPERQMMTLRQFENALDRHRQEALAYLETLGDEDLQRKARIPRFKRLLGTDEVTMAMWVEVLFASHWGDHADQLAKIRKAVGLPEATPLVTATYRASRGSVGVTHVEERAHAGEPSAAYVGLRERKVPRRRWLHHRAWSPRAPSQKEYVQGPCPWTMPLDHAPSEWEPGSGRVRQGEAHLAALLREVKEETGLDVTVLGPLNTFHFYRGTAQEEAIGITFHCRTTGGNLTLSSEHVEAKWVPFEQLLALDCSDWMRRAFAALLARGNQAAGRSA